MDPVPAAARPSSRIDLVDVLRGIAIAAMVVYHFSWDLSFYRFVGWPVDTGTGWRWFAHLIAGSFIVLVGVSLVLAHRNGIRWRGFLQRLALVVVAAAAVSLGSYLLFPEAWIYFGILHCIAAASLLAVLTVRAPLIVPIVLAVVFFALPHVARADVFNAAGLAWVGLGTLPPPQANDYVPIFPWAGCAYAGVVLARVALMLRSRAAWSQWRARDGASRAVAWSGRQSLWIYLAHQPILLGILGLIAFAVPPQPAATPAQRASFLDSCERQCAPTLGDPQACQAVCVCAADNIEQAGLWERTITQSLGTADQDRVTAIVDACGVQARDARPVE